MRVWLSLGSNLGDREAAIRETFRMLSGVCERLELSSIYETEPLDVVSQPRFLNAVAAGTTRLAPRELLAAVQAIEGSLGRNRSVEVRRGPRTIDVDILLYEGHLSDDPELTLPHPRLAERAFVLVPLLEIAPDLADPRTGEAYAAALARIGQAGVYSYPVGKYTHPASPIADSDVPRETRPVMSDNGPPEKQHFHLKDFDGPLDLLLFLIKQSEVNIYDIPIASITEQYLSVLGWSAKADLDTMSEFYLMAATLLYIKSRMLLPVELDLDDEIEDPRRELVEKLIEYQKFRRLSDLMSEKEGEVEWIVERGRDQRILPFTDDGIWGEVSVWDLLQTFSSLLSSLSAERIIDLYEEVSINEKVTLIGEMLESRDEFLFTDLLRRRSVLEVVCAFFAVLEMVKARHITVFQNRLFGDIRIKARPPVALETAAASRAAPASEAGSAPIAVRGSPTAEETTRHEP